MAEDHVEIVNLDKNSIDSEDIVCVRGPQNMEGINCKKEWLKARFREGLKFKKLIIGGRSWGFIEYLPAENAWRPINAPGYMFIDCIWVIGRHKGKGYGRMLLDECINDSTSKNGLCVVTSDKPSLASKDLFLRNGFEVCDTAPPHYELLVRRMKDAASPTFNESVRRTIIDHNNGLVFVYSDQCPYIAKFMNVMIEAADEQQIPVKRSKIGNAKEAQEMPFAFGTFGVFYDGKFLTHDIMTKKGFAKLLNETVNI